MEATQPTPEARYEAAKKSKNIELIAEAQATLNAAAFLKTLSMQTMASN